MDAILLVVALAVLLAGGAGIALLLAGDRALGRLELLGLSILLGTGVVTLASFWLGRLLVGGALRLAVTTLCLALAGWGLSRRRAQEQPVSPGPSWPGIFATMTVVATTALVGWVAARTTLGWDGIAVWELKARIAALSAGRIPASYFSDPTRQWSHPYYPLQVPLAEWWIYGWTGDADQSLAKLVFPFLYLGGAAVLAASARRLGGPWCGPVAVVVLLCVPEVLTGGGGAASGYADFPLAIYYLAAIAYAVEYGVTGSRGVLGLAASFGAVLPWIKQEGVLAWVGLCAVGFLATRYGRRFAHLVALAAPGAVTFVAWRLFLVQVETPSGAAFLPFTLPTLLANSARLPVIGMAIIEELVRPERWSYLWPAVLLAIVWAWPTPQRRASLLLAVAIVTPLALSSAAYVMSAWTPFEGHVHSSLPRLVLQMVPVAVLLIVIGLVPAAGRAPASAIGEVEPRNPGNGTMG